MSLSIFYALAFPGTVKLTVDVTNPELDALEDVLTVWNLCPTHSAASTRATERRVVGWQYGCVRCQRARAERLARCMRLWTKLSRAYDRL